MKSSKLFIRIIQIMILIIISFNVKEISSEWAQITYTSSLSPDQVVPIQSDIYQNSLGVAVCTLDRTKSEADLECHIQHNIFSITELAICVGPRGELGQVLYTFSQFYAYSITAKLTLTSINNYTVAEQVDDFLNGLWYLSLSSYLFPSGELRGQIEHTDRAYSILLSSNEVPASTSSSQGICISTYSDFDPFRRITFNFVHSVTDPTTLQVFSGEIGAIGNEQFSFDGRKGSPLYDYFTLTDLEEKDFYNDLLYLNLLSSTYPKGEIRGQLISIDYPDNVGFTARLGAGEVVNGDSTGVESDNTGCSIFAFDCSTRLLEFIVIHTIRDSQSVSISFGESGVIGPALYSVDSRNQSSVFGSVRLTPEEQYYLYTYQLYVWVNSDDFPSGEIRGQIDTTNDFYSYLSGTFVTTPVTTSALGCATFTFTQENRTFNYAVYHTVKNALSVNLGVGSEGEGGFIDRIFPAVESPIRGDTFILDDDEIEALAYDRLYVQVVSTDYPFVGEIRGQIKQLKPCKPQAPYGEFVPSSNPRYVFYTGNTVDYASSNSFLLIPNLLFIVIVIFCLII